MRIPYVDLETDKAIHEISGLAIPGLLASSKMTPWADE